MKNLTIGYALCGSFCTIQNSMDVLEKLAKLEGIKIIPIMSEIVYKTDTRFGKADDLKHRVEELCGTSIIHDIPSAEPIGPKNLLDIIVVAPCTGNTTAKIANGITDTSVTMASKATLRNKKPVIIAVSTNDGLGANAENLGRLLARKHMYFVPFGQDAPMSKTCSLVADFSLLTDTVSAALEGRQLQPILLQK